MKQFLKYFNCVRAVIALLIALLAFGCTTVETIENGKVTKKTVSILGYNLGPPKREDGIYKVYIPRIGNESMEPHLQMEATNLIIDEFTKEQSYYIVPRPDEADGILNVVITKITMSPIRYVDRKINKEAAGVPLEFRVIVYANVEMQNPDTKQPVWKLNQIAGKYTFSITGEYPFQEGRRAAIIEACKDLAHEIVDNSVERWD